VKKICEGLYSCPNDKLYAEIPENMDAYDGDKIKTNTT